MCVNLLNREECIRISGGCKALVVVARIASDDSTVHFPGMKDTCSPAYGHGVDLLCLISITIRGRGRRIVILFRSVIELQKSGGGLCRSISRERKCICRGRWWPKFEVKLIIEGGEGRGSVVASDRCIVGIDFERECIDLLDGETEGVDVWEG